MEADALKLDASVLGDAPRRIVANLPYNVATPLLLAWLISADRFERLVLMFQREVAMRLSAPPGGKDYGRLSVAAQWRCRIRRLFDIPPRAFTPAPKVTSTLVELLPLPAPDPPADPACFEQVSAAAFGQRRKMLRHALRRMGCDPEELLAAAGIDGTRRAEELSVAEFAALANALAKRRPASIAPRAGP